jgi:hypothetical protein
MESIYNFLSEIGLNTIFRRFLFATILLGIIEYFWKPFYAFQEDGKLRQWAIINSESEEPTTYLPFMALPLMGGFLFGFFV